MKNFWGRYRSVFTVILVLAAAAASLVFYVNIITGKIYDANAGQLSELYSVAASNFLEHSTSSFKHLSTSYSVIEMNDEETAITSFIDQARANWGYTHFFFLDQAGNYRTVHGKDGRFDLDAHYHNGIDTGLNMAKPCTIPGEGDILLYITPVETGVFQGFEYRAIAIGYDRSAFDALLKVGAYEADARTWVIGSDGRIVLENSGYASNSIYKLLDSDGTSFRYGNLDDFRDAVRSSGDYNALVRMDGEDYYIALVDVGYSDWSMLGVVPAKSVDGSMVDVQRMTILFVGGIIVILALLSAQWVWQRGRKAVREKDTELKYREQLFNVLSSQTSEVFLMFTPGSTRAEYISPNVERVMGVPYETAKNDLYAICPGLSDEEKQAVKERIDALPLDAPVYNELHWTNPVTAMSQWFSVTDLRVGLDGEEKFITVFSDATKEAQSRQCLQEALDIAESANKAKSSFLSNMSHDIRTPINAVVGLCALLKRDADNPEKVRQHTQKITASSNHLLGLINDILDMSKIESGKVALNIAEFTLREWIDEVDTMLRPMAHAKQQHFEITAHSIVHETVMGDKLRLNQIMINILSNAIKYTPQEGSITFSIEELDQSSAHTAKYRFRIADTGMGMSEEYQRTIFEPFTREVNSTVNKIQGTGLGMAITKHLVDLMGGTITVESEQGRGSTFTVTVELRIVEREQDFAFWKEHGIERVLIVDDDVETCHGIAVTMRGYGIDAQFVTHGEEAVALADKFHQKNADFNAFIVDMKMEGMNGLETALLIREKVSRTVPLFIHTAWDMDNMEAELREAGVSGVLPKPFFMANFMHAIETLKDVPSAAPEAGHSELSISGLHFLAAEDNELNAEILNELLDMEGATCVLCENGKLVYERFLQSTPGEFDAILMDVQMPVMNGYEAARAIRSSSHPSAADIPIIAMTANAFDEDVRDALDAGMSAHVSKPIDMERLIAAVNRFLDKKDT